MTEIDAHIFGLQDAQRVLQAAAQTQAKPMQLIELVEERLLHRIYGLEHGLALPAAKNALRSIGLQQTISGTIGQRFLAVLRATYPHVHPEDISAILAWALGSRNNRTNGFMQEILAACGCQRYGEVVRSLEEEHIRIQVQFHRSDAKLLHERSKAMPATLRNHVAELLQRAEWYWQALDGEASRSCIISARYIVQRFSPAART